MIECDLVELPEYTGFNSIKKRYARYSNTCHWTINSFGVKKWVILAYIEPAKNDVLEDCDNRETITKGCLDFLNQPPPRKKYAKKPPKPKYGELEFYKASLTTKNGKKYISAALITNQRKHKLFWGKGRSV